MYIYILQDAQVSISVRPRRVFDALVYHLRYQQAHKSNMITLQQEQQQAAASIQMSSLQTTPNTKQHQTNTYSPSTYTIDSNSITSATQPYINTALSSPMASTSPLSISKSTTIKNDATYEKSSDSFITLSKTSVSQPNSTHSPIEQQDSNTMERNIFNNNDDNSNNHHSTTVDWELQYKLAAAGSIFRVDAIDCGYSCTKTCCSRRVTYGKDEALA